MQQSIEAITQSILQGSQLKRGDDCSFLLETDLSELCTQANRLRQHFCGNQVDLCTIINGKSGRCSEDCKFVLSPPTIIPAAPNMDFWMWIRLR